MERSITDFSPYELGKIVVAYQASEHFAQYDALLHKASKYNPHISGINVQLDNGDGQLTDFFVSKHMVFALYLIKEQARKDLLKCGQQEVVAGIDNLFKPKYWFDKAA